MKLIKCLDVWSVYKVVNRSYRMNTYLWAEHSKYESALMRANHYKSLNKEKVVILCLVFPITNIAQLCTSHSQHYLGNVLFCYIFNIVFLLCVLIFVMSLKTVFSIEKSRFLNRNIILISQHISESKPTKAIVVQLWYLVPSRSLSNTTLYAFSIRLINWYSIVLTNKGELNVRVKECERMIP